MPEIPDGAINNADRKNDSRSASYLLSKKKTKFSLSSTLNLEKALAKYFEVHNSPPITDKEFTAFANNLYKKYNLASENAARKVVRNARKTYFNKLLREIIRDFSERPNLHTINVFDEIEHYSFLYNLPSSLTSNLVNSALKYVYKFKKINK